MGQGQRPNPNWRIRGGALVVLGLFLVLMMAIIAWNTAPLMLRPGVEVEGTTFNGSAAQGLLILGLFAVVGTFGGLCVANGLHMLITGVANGLFANLAYAIFLFLIVFAFGTRIGLV